MKKSTFIAFAVLSLNIMPAGYAFSWNTNIDRDGTLIYSSKTERRYFIRLTAEEFLKFKGKVGLGKNDPETCKRISNGPYEGWLGAKFPASYGCSKWQLNTHTVFTYAVSPHHFSQWANSLHEALRAKQLRAQGWEPVFDIYYKVNQSEPHYFVYDHSHQIVNIEEKR